ncbi:proline-rich extensin-like protein EPR1 isoform X2 [Phalaenopsis equestris]|uniref:proline-rich extensin-like protein EPR1 isoform X2 n=1 Tax=Phalaenopsis equestris TaxID=78828 RepID=UPI0009E269BD|nr:proline-rich extensin-like protein EPR1 isoform X2 [Phalaenopsis equestris]
MPLLLGSFSLIHKDPMSTKVDSPSSTEPRQALFSGSPTVSASSPRVSMFGAKAGFVIPKNKLSGSLVPIFRGGSKADTGSVVKEENTKQVQRKTKWGIDLTQDANVRKGKALAYQTRVEQITQQLKSGSLEFEDDQGPESPKQDSTSNSEINHVDNKCHKAELLELERRELIGEILRLNPSYKAPPDYKPLLKESKVLIPFKTYPGYNFVGLLLGPESNTQKRLEEETGAKVRVYGIKSGLGEKREITKSDISEAPDAYDDIYVLVSADTYEKVDTAVALIELLLTPVSGNAGISPKGAPSSAGINEDVQTKNPDSSGFSMTPQPSSLPVIQADQTPFQPYPGHWFPATTPNVLSHPSSAFMPPLFPNNPAPILRPPLGVPQYFARPSGILSVSITSTPAVLRPTLPIQLPPNQSPSGPISQRLSSGPVAPLRPPGPVNPQIGPPIRPLITPIASSSWPPASNAPLAWPGSNLMVPPLNTTMKPLAFPSAPTSSRPSQSNVSDNAARPAANFAPHSISLIPTRPSTSQTNFSLAPSQTGLVPTAGIASLFPNSSIPPPLPVPGSLISPPPPQAPLLRPTSFSQIAPASVMATPSPSVVRAPIPLPTTSRAQAPMPVQPQLKPPQPPPAISPSNSTISPTFPPPTNSPVGAPPPTTPKPLRPISGDFTFQPLGTQLPSPPSSPASHPSAIQNSLQAPFAAPKAPSFRPALHSPMPAALAQSSARTPVLPAASAIASFPANASNIRPPPTPILQAYPGLTPVQPMASAIPVGKPSFPRASQAPNPSGTMPSYPTTFQQVHQNQLPHVSRPGGSLVVPNLQLGTKPIGFTAGDVHSTPGGSQIYDPFSPTASAAPPHQGTNNPANIKKPETDAEYEDLMASVGVK